MKRYLTLALLTLSTLAYGQAVDEDVSTNVVVAIQPGAIKIVSDVRLDLVNNQVTAFAVQYSTNAATLGTIVLWPDGKQLKESTINLSAFLNATDNTNTVNDFKRKLKKRMAKASQ